MENIDWFRWIMKSYKSTRYFNGFHVKNSQSFWKLFISFSERRKSIFLNVIMNAKYLSFRTKAKAANCSKMSLTLIWTKLTKTSQKQKPCPKVTSLSCKRNIKCIFENVHININLHASKRFSWVSEKPLHIFFWF